MNEQFRPSFWRSGLGSLAGLVLFVVLMALIPQPRLEGVPLVVVGFILALVPAALWLVFFYQFDRGEPEPKRVIARVFFFGGVMASGPGLLLINDLFRVEDWWQVGPWVRFGALFLVVGFTQEFLKYLAVRYTVFPTADLHGRVDGVIYGVAAGLGYATALNIEYVLANQGVVPFVGSVRMVDTALAQAGFAAITGYFLAGAKYGGRPVWWVPVGLTSAALLNALVATLRREVTVRGFTYHPLNAVLLAVAFVVVALGILFAIVRRAQWRAATEE